MIGKIKTAAKYVNAKLANQAVYGLILGTGLNNMADLIKEPVIIPYKDIPNMPVSTAPSHQGRLIAGYLNNTYVIILQGRIHFYEGYSMYEVTFPVRLLKELGVTTLIITNAAGSLNENLQAGDVVMIKDHINFMGTNPLIGPDDPRLGERFPSMNQPYDKQLQDEAFQIAQDHEIELKSGVYLAVMGPSLETRSECLMFQKLGADLVGMSTVPETIVGVQEGLKILGFSVVTNMSNIFHNQAHSQEEIRENAFKARKKLEIIISKILENDKDR